MTQKKLQVPVDESQYCQTVNFSRNEECQTGTQVSRQNSLQIVKDYDDKSTKTGWYKSVLVVLSSHFVLMNTSGFTNSFGALQSHFVDMFDQPSSTVSWIGSMQMFLFFFIGIFSGRLTDAGYFRVISLLGSLANIFGILAASFSNGLWAMYITLGLGVGLGNGCMACPVLTVMSPYFSSRRGLAIGIAMSGSCTGGLMYSAIMRQLIPAVGFPWTMRVIALVQLITLSFVNLCLRPRSEARTTPGWVDWSAFRDWRYNHYTMAGFASLLSLYISIFFIVDYSRTAIMPPLSYSNSLNLLLVFNGINLFGRLGFSRAADRFGMLPVFVTVSGATAITLFSWIAVRTAPGLYVWAVFCGTFSGGVQSLWPTGLGYLTAGTEKPGTRIGMAFGIVSIASLVGSPIGGALVSAMDGRYLGAQIFGGVTMSLCALFLEAARRLDTPKPHELKTTPATT